MSDRGEADFSSESGEEDMLVDKKHIDCQLHILMKLDELCRHLDNTLRHLLGILPYCVPLHLQH